jgi:hypothetical protein
MAVIICFSEYLLVFENEAFDLAQIMRFHASIACQKDGWLQPEFAVSVRRSHMDMRGLIALVGIKMESERMLQAEKQPRGSRFQQGCEVLRSYFLRTSKVSRARQRVGSSILFGVFLFDSLAQPYFDDRLSRDSNKVGLTIQLLDHPNRQININTFLIQIGTPER